ncbi:hypothetical protein CKO15_06180 [Halorhodospira abdelmalekii]|uniref:hypothetical protein n=1 Tax=Halorhodospira abdelmalekii TaxID=421629 RepID=UPI00190329E3|nr:hypothetical protein [Halorhodospira abdelmalekii]MBK1734884.1 hypothetical protein [Halorhodospira abdelmalekii]
MQCYSQVIPASGSFAAPGPEHYQAHRSIQEALEHFRWETSIHARLDDSTGAELMVWLGTPDPDDPYPCDLSSHPPDRIYVMGPWGGVRRVL